MKTYDLAIIGAGAAGLSSAIEAYKKGIKNIILFEKGNDLGGILNQCIHSGFGLHIFKEELTGPSYAERLANDVLKLPITLKTQTMVLAISPSLSINYANSQEGFQEIQAKVILLTSGSYERNAGAIQLPGKRVQGIMSAGLAQYYLNIEGYFTGKKAFIVGSGDIGLIMARRLTLEGIKVLGVAEIMPYSNGLARNLQQCLYDFDIPLYLSHRVIDVTGDTHVTSITLAEVDKDFTIIPNTEKIIEADCLLLSVGLLPDSSFAKQANIELSPKTKGPLVDDTYMTSTSGIFVAGNALHIHDLVDDVSMEARRAINGISHYLQGTTTDKMGHLVFENEMSYLIPNTFHLSPKNDITLAYRVKRPLRKARFEILKNNVILISKTMVNVLPSLMQTYKLDKDIIQDAHTICVRITEEL